MVYQHITFNTESFSTLGRSNMLKDGTAQLPWSDSGFAFRFKGTGVIFHFAPYITDAVAYVRVWFDNKPQRFALVNGSEKIILEGEDTIHEVRFLRVTEGLTPIIVKEATLFGEAPKMLKKPEPKKMLIEFIGDSITCGYGVMGNPETVTFEMYEEDSSRAYAHRTAERLNADVSISGASGKGIVANCLGDRADMTLRQAFSWADCQKAPYPFKKRRIPDIIVVNAGTNDAGGGIQDDEFISTGVTFLKEIRKAYPRKPILYCYGVMDKSKSKAAEEIVKQFNKKYGKAYFVSVECIYDLKDEIGGAGHPNTNTSERVSAILAKEIRRIMKEQSL